MNSLKLALLCAVVTAQTSQDDENEMDHGAMAGMDHSSESDDGMEDSDSDTSESSEDGMEGMDHGNMDMSDTSDDDTNELMSAWTMF